MQVNCTQHIFYRTHSFTSEFRPCCFARTHSMHPQSRQFTGQTQKLEKEKSFLAFQELVLKTEELRITSSWCQSQCVELWYPELQNTPLIKGAFFHTSQQRAHSKQPVSANFPAFINPLDIDRMQLKLAPHTECLLAAEMATRRTVRGLWKYGPAHVISYQQMLLEALSCAGIFLHKSDQLHLFLSQEKPQHTYQWHIQ